MREMLLGFFAFATVVFMAFVRGKASRESEQATHDAKKQKEMEKVDASPLGVDESLRRLRDRAQKRTGK